VLPRYILMLPRHTLGHVMHDLGLWWWVTLCTIWTCASANLHSLYIVYTTWYAYRGWHLCPTPSAPDSGDPMISPMLCRYPLKWPLLMSYILTCFLVLADALEFSLWPIEVLIDPTRFNYGKQGEGVWTCKKLSENLKYFWHIAQFRFWSLKWVLWTFNWWTHHDDKHHSMD
jgi:hypothetical protein